MHQVLKMAPAQSEGSVSVGDDGGGGGDGEDGDAAHKAVDPFCGSLLKRESGATAGTGRKMG